MRVTPQQFIEAARAYVGVPFGHLGHFAPGVVPPYLDCDGLVARAAQDCAILPAGFVLAHHGQVPSARMFARLLEHCEEVERDQMQPGDVVTLTADPARPRPTHLAIVTDAGLIQASVDKIVETGLTGLYLPRIIGVYRWKAYGEDNG